MNTTSLHIKIEADMKKEAQKTAQDLGLSLSAVMKALLKQFIRTKKLSVELPEIPNAHLRKILENELEGEGEKGISFASTKDALAYLDQEIADEKRTAN